MRAGCACYVVDVWVVASYQDFHPDPLKLCHGFQVKISAREGETLYAKLRNACRGAVSEPYLHS